MAALNHTSSSSSSSSSIDQASSRRNGNGEEQLEHPPAAAAAAADAVWAATSDRPELVDDASGLPLPIDMLEGRYTEGSAAASLRNRAPPSSLEVMDDDDGPPVPVGMDEWGDCNESNKIRGVDVIEDDAGPEDTLASLEQNAKTNFVNDLSPPTPFDLSSLEVDEGGQKNTSVLSDVDSILIPTREEIEDEDPQFINRLDANRRIPPMHNQINIDSNRPTEENTVDTGGVNNATNYHDLEQDTTSGSDLEQDRSTQIIPEAYLVEDNGTVIEGEPLLPWYKQRRTKMFLCAFISIIAILAVSLGVPLSLKTDVVLRADHPSESPTGMPSNVPSTTTSPSFHRSDSPSTSLVPTTVRSIEPTSTPSYSPSACVNKISSNAKKIELKFDELYPVVAVDGMDMVVVAQKAEFDKVFIIFYTLSNREWQRIKTFHQEDWLLPFYSVAISGKTAFVGCANDDTGAALVYEKDQYGDWNLIEDPFIHDPNAFHILFGSHVDIDGELACVAGDDNIHLYHRENSKWVQIDSIIYGDMCKIAENTIAVRGYNGELGEHLQLYKYNQELDEVVQIQDPIPTGWIPSLDLSHDYLFYWGSAEHDAIIYHRNATRQTYTFLQQLNIAGPEDNYGLQIDNDILVVRSNDKTRIFSEQNDRKWKETITLDQSYDEYALSGRSLVAIKEDDVYYFDIEECSQAMPTQTPSLSMVPTGKTSPFPSMSPSLSFVPSSSLSPTETCYWIQVDITHDFNPYDTSWEIHRLASDGDGNELVKSHQGWFGDTSHVESLCLQEAKYIFIINDSSGDGICCNSGEGHYKVTSYDMLIVEGGEWEGRSESTTFSLPFTLYPSMSPFPTLAPSTSFTPTETCYLIQVAIAYDSYPEETEWELQRVVGEDGANELVDLHSGIEGDTSYVESFCLQEAEYIFTIHDSSLDGICCSWGVGNYNVTSDGMLIVEGGDFESQENTTFSLPFFSST